MADALGIDGNTETATKILKGTVNIKNISQWIKKYITSIQYQDINRINTVKADIEVDIYKKIWKKREKQQLHPSLVYMLVITRLLHTMMT